ncbi:MAG: acetate--CoA ligase family protein [Deltaproteobacteria bacterium]|nr:acetate--CoA ligase family protein [Deltaproteobacteria bacterium]
MSAAKAAGRRNLAAQEVYGILEAYGFPTAEWRVAGNADEAVAAAEAIAFRGAQATPRPSRTELHGRCCG